MQDAIDFLFLRTWWAYGGESSPYNAPYHWFNLFECAAWLVMATLVLRRWARLKQSRIELWYALAFFTFGLTDLREAWALQSWLIWLKLINLIALIRLRWIVMKRFYPASRLY